MERLARVVNGALCASTSLSLLFFFDASVAVFSPLGAPPAWLRGPSLAAVRLYAQLYAAALFFFAANNVFRALGIRAVFLSCALSCLLVARAFLALASEGPLLVAPELWQSLLAVVGILSFVNLVAEPWVINAAVFLLLAVVGATVPLGEQLVSPEAWELCSLQLAYLSVVGVAAAVLFLFRIPFLSAAVLFGLSALNALRVAAFVFSCAPESHLSFPAAIGTAASLAAACVLNSVLAIRHLHTPIDETSRKKKQKSD